MSDFASAPVLPLLGFPLAGMAVAVAASLLSLGEAGRSAPAGHPVRLLDARVQVFLVFPFTLLLFGLVLFRLYPGYAERGVPAEILAFGAHTYGVSALLVGLGYAAVFYRGVGPSVRNPEVFPRTIVLAVLPEALLVLVLVFCLRLATVALAVLPSMDPSAFVVRAQQGALYVVLGSLAAPLSGALSAASWDFASLEAWPPAVIRGVAGVVPGIALFFLAMLLLVG